MKIKSLLLSSFLIISVGGYCQKKQIKIHGVVKDYPNNTRVVLANTSTEKPIDTTYINNEAFIFKISKMDTLMLGVFIDNPDLGYFDNEMIVFFAEDKDIRLVGEKGSLKYAQVTGGPVQNQYSQFKSSIEPYSKHFDELNTMGFEAKANSQSARVDSISSLQDEIIQKRIAIGIQYIVDNPSYFYSLLRLQSSMPALSINQAAELFQHLDENLQKHRIGKSIESIINEKQLKVGDTAPNFQLANVNGRIIKLSDFKGQYVLIDFWASWCTPCRIENKSLVANYNEFNKEGFEIISISGDKDRDKWIEASKKDSITWNNLIENQEEPASQKYNVLLIPTNFLIDPDGKVIEKNLKGDDLNKKLRSIFN